MAKEPTLSEKAQGGCALMVFALIGGCVLLATIQDDPESPPEPAKSAALVKFEKTNGPLPTRSWSSWTAVDAWMRQNLNDPKSLDYIDVAGPFPYVTPSGARSWIVHAKYRAKNAFGGYVIETRAFAIRNDQVIEAKPTYYFD